MTDDNGEGAKSDLPGMGARRTGVVALGVALLAVLAAVLLTGARPVHGKPAADASALRAPAEEFALPPPPPGTEYVSSPGVSVSHPAQVGSPVLHGSTGAIIELQLDSYEAVSDAPEPAGRAPDGYRWLLLTFHLANVDGGDWRVRMFDRVSALDDRGQALRPFGDGQVPCAGQSAVTVGVEAAAEVDVCGVIPVPNATPVVAVDFQYLDYPVRFPVSLPAAGDPALPAGPFASAGNPISYLSDGIPMHVTADVVTTPSGYFDGSRPPEPGTRFVVVRMAITVTGKRDLLPVNFPYLLDDRGVLLAADAFSMRTLPGCREPLMIVRAGKPDWGCYVFAIDADVPVAGVTWGPDPAKFGEWPRWTVG